MYIGTLQPLAKVNNIIFLLFKYVACHYVIGFAKFNILYIADENSSIGNWSTEGCDLNKQLSDIRAGTYVCECTHLSNFAMLLVSL